MGKCLSFADRLKKYYLPRKIYLLVTEGIISHILQIHGIEVTLVLLIVIPFMELNILC